MDEYDCYQTDKQMSKKLNAIFTDPKRHAFYACFNANEDEGLTGPRGGKIRGKKRICHYCGLPRKGHAEQTEQL